MNVDRTKVTIVSPGRHGDEEAVRLGKSELLSFVWELTEEIYSLTGRDDVQSRLQRNVVSITRQ